MGKERRWAGTSLELANDPDFKSFLERAEAALKEGRGLELAPGELREILPVLRSITHSAGLLSDVLESQASQTMLAVGVVVTVLEAGLLLASRRMGGWGY